MFRTLPHAQRVQLVMSENLGSNFRSIPHGSLMRQDRHQHHLVRKRHAQVCFPVAGPRTLPQRASRGGRLIFWLFWQLFDGGLGLRIGEPFSSQHLGHRSAARITPSVSP